MNANPILLPFPRLAGGLVEGSFVRRVKRFSVEFESGGERFWAHTNNSGAMRGLTAPGLPLLLSRATAPGRKLAYTLELVGLEHTGGRTWVGVNTLIPNRLLKAAFLAGLLPWAAGYTNIRPEARRGQSRLDALFTGPQLPPLWVECKNVTLLEDGPANPDRQVPNRGGTAAFPDAVSERAQKHLREMTEIVKNGERAACFYCIQRADAACFAPADHIDAKYAELFRLGLAAGVEVYPYRAAITVEKLVSGDSSGDSPGGLPGEIRGGIGLGELLPLLPY
ncbi:MAG: DNA/RNA nuclease SfsA [Deltaproteobacteria bacterium]|jgi:sugar fermentation stimulation protein A|nr:DNA/RNA nuclease SfsA [Deltaproteobacteria bacterium]